MQLRFVVVPYTEFRCKLFHAVCIGLIWDSECPEVEQITQLLDCIDPVLRLHEVSSLPHVLL